MSAIGKIFVILNLVFSLVIVGMAASYLSKADNWKTKYETLDKTFTTEKKDLEDQVAEKNSRIDTLVREADDKQSNIDTLEVTNNNLNERLQSEEVSNQQLRDSVDQIRSTLADFRQNMNDLSNRNNELADQNTQLRNDALDAQNAERQARADLQRRVNSLERAQERVTALEGSLAQLEQEKGRLESLIEIAQSAGFDISNLMAMKKVDAQVVEVDNSLGFVVLSVGKDDEVSKGWTFQIFRDDQYLGEVEIDEVYDKYSAARIKFQVDGTQIMVADNATTVL